MKKTLTFLKKIKKNNNTQWMQGHKSEYLEARKEFEFLVQEIIVRLSQWDDRFGTLEPKDCIFRFNRDIRFSDNKNPYKENFAAFFGMGGKKSTLPGYYVSISPNEVFAGGGVWRPEADKLQLVRRYILENGDELKKIVTSKSFKKTFGGLSDEDTLKRVPRGFDADHPFADFVKLKSFIASKDFSVKEATEKGFGQKIDKVFRELKPLNDFLTIPLRRMNPQQA
ncbi:MAG: DUF2461 domain-containing protein [Bacteriovoracaceae bacterium]